VTPHPVTPEARLRKRCDCRAVTVPVGGRTLELLLQRTADALIDEVAFAADERMPYRADLWPSAVALATFVSEDRSFDAHAASGLPVLELGCGVGLVSLAAALRGVPVVASDHEKPALDFVAVRRETTPTPTSDGTRMVAVEIIERTRT